MASELKLRDEEYATTSEDESEDEVEKGSQSRPSTCQKRMLCGVIMLVLIFLVARPLSRSAAIADVGAAFDFEVVNLTGAFEERTNFSLTVRGRPQPLAWPASATWQLRDGSLWAKVEGGGEDLSRIGSLSAPEVTSEPFKQLSLNLQAELLAESPDLVARSAAGLLGETASWRVKGYVDVAAWLFGVFPIYLSGLPLDREVSTPGLASFSKGKHPIVADELLGASGTPEALSLRIGATLKNPSFVGATIEHEVMLGMTTPSGKLGVAAINGLRLVPGGESRVELDLRVAPPASEDPSAPARDLVAGMLEARSQAVTLVGNEHSSLDPAIGRLLAGLSFDLELPPPSSRFLTHITARVSPSGINAKLKIYNPFPQAATLNGIDLQVYLKSAPDAMIFALDSSEVGFLAPGGRLAPKEFTNVSLELDIFAAKAGAITQLKDIIEDAKDNTIMIQVRGPISLTIDPGFPLTVQYDGNELDSRLGWCILCM